MRKRLLRKETMKLDVCCMQCQREKGITNEEKLEVELNDSGLMQATCSCGHKNLIILQNPKYELLFDLGGMALIDGYTREAVSSIAAALERFYEFFIHVAFIHNKCKDDLFTNYWKIIAKQSERQLGSFYTSYISLFYELPPKLSDSKVTFRNNVIHNGYLATETEVIEYGQEVGSIIQTISKKLLDFDQEAFRQEVFKRFNSELQRSNIKDIPVTTSCIPTMLSTAVADFAIHDFDFSKKLEELKEYRTFVYTEHRRNFHKDFNLKTIRNYCSMIGVSLPYQYDENL